MAALDNFLAGKFPGLAQEWYPIENGDLTPYDATPFSSKKRWWQCLILKERVWQATVSNRSYGTKCPYCSRYRIDTLSK